MKISNKQKQKVVAQTQTKMGIKKFLRKAKVYKSSKKTIKNMDTHILGYMQVVTALEIDILHIVDFTGKSDFFDRHNLVNIILGNHMAVLNKVKDTDNYGKKVKEVEEIRIKFWERAVALTKEFKR